MKYCHIAITPKICFCTFGFGRKKNHDHLTLRALHNVQVSHSLLPEDTETCKATVRLRAVPAFMP